MYYQELSLTFELNWICKKKKIFLNETATFSQIKGSEQHPIFTGNLPFLWQCTNNFTKGVHQYFFVLVSKRVPGIVQYALNLYKLLINAYNMSVRLNAGAHRYWQSSRGDSPCHLEALWVCSGKATINTASDTQSALTEAHSCCEIKPIAQSGGGSNKPAGTSLSIFWEILFLCVCLWFPPPLYLFYFYSLSVLMPMVSSPLQFHLTLPQAHMTLFHFP